MAVIGPCAYDYDGTLIKPDQSAIDRALIGPDFCGTGVATAQQATFEVGHTHLYVFSVHGRDTADVRDKAQNALQRFADLVDAYAPNEIYTEIKRKRNVRTTRNSTATTYEYTLVYAIEDPMRSRSARPGATRHSDTPRTQTHNPGSRASRSHHATAGQDSSSSTRQVAAQEALASFERWIGPVR